MEKPDPSVGVVIFDGAEELDFVGPWEVFTGAKKALSDDPYGMAGDLGVKLVAQAHEPVTCAKGMRVLPHATFDEVDALDVVLVPGGIGTRRECENPLLLDWLRVVAADARWVTSVCTGALVLHGAGLTRGRRITTHWAFVETLRELAGNATVLDSVRYVRDGNLVTAAGVSAGIDMALWLVGQVWSVRLARSVQKGIEYDPAPPYGAEV